MDHRYQKICIEKNPFFTIHHGKGMYYSDCNTQALHYDTDLTVTYFKHCCGTIKIEGKCYNLKDGDIVIMNTNEIHCCTIDGGTYHERISLFINENFFKNFPFDCTSLFDRFQKRTARSNNLITVNGIDNLFSEILIFAKENNKVLCMCKITELIWKLNNFVSFSNKAIVTENNSLTDNILLYINEHFTENLSCNKIAELFYISKFRLEHIFKETVGVSLWDYVILRRLLYCNELLKQNHTVKSASQLSGFNNYSNFYRLYKKHLNTTPVEYKKALKITP